MGATHLCAIGVSRHTQSGEDQTVTKERETKDMEQDTWLATGATMVSEGKEWRTAHPKATVVDSEDEVHRRMMQVEAHLVQDVAQERSRRVWGKDTGGEAPRCLTSQVPLPARGHDTRPVQGHGAERVTLLRTDGTCPHGGERFFPPR
jgi:hypothetical protein